MEEKIFFLIGKNFILLEEKIKELSKNNNIRISFNKDIKDFFNYLQIYLNPRLTGERFDIIIRNIEKINSSDLKKLILILQNIQQKIFFICVNEPTELFALLRKSKIRFKIIREDIKNKKNLTNFIFEILKKKNLQLSPQVIDFLIENYSENIDVLINDLNKITNLNEDDFKSNLKYFFSLLPNNFKIHDLFLDRKWIDFIHNFKKFIAEDKSKDKIDTLKLFNFLANSLIRIFLIKKSKKIKGNFYYLNKLRSKSQNISLEEIKHLIFALAKTEKKLKKYSLKIKDIPEDIYYNYLLKIN